MSETIVRNREDKQTLIEVLRATKIPYTVTVRKGTHRTLEQNRLQFMWMKEAADQLHEYRPEEYRAICKLTIGIPILRGEDQEFRELYDKTVKRLNYEDKVALMDWFPVTSLMSTGQKKLYLDDVYVYLTGLGARLTEPDDGLDARHR